MAAAVVRAKGRLQPGPLPQLRRLRFQPGTAELGWPPQGRDGAAEGGSEQPRESSIMSHSHQQAPDDLSPFRFVSWTDGEEVVR